MNDLNKPLYTKSFFVLCLSYALFGSSFNMIVPELPSFLSNMGGEDYKGFIISLFTLTAGLSRPISGKLADTIGRVPVIMFGTIVCVICSLCYPILSTVGGFMLLRLLHGFSTGFTPTAMTAYIADVVPDHRRGEAMGIIGVSLNVGSSIGPPVGSQLALSYSLNTMFMASSLVAALSLIILTGIKETLPHKESLKLSHLRLKKSEIIDRNTIIPAVICGLIYIGLGGLLTIAPDQCDFLGVANKGLFFTSFTVCSIMSRLVAGKISDIYGRIKVIGFAVVLMVLSYILLAMANSGLSLLIATGCLGFSLGIGAPALFAWTIDRSTDSNRGKAMGTLYIGLEIAIGSGALLSAYVYSNTPENFKTVFLIMAGITALAIIFLKRESKTSVI
jgi:MFS family permease